jgi:hypothetical protein
MVAGRRWFAFEMFGEGFIASWQEPSPPSAIYFVRGIVEEFEPIVPGPKPAQPANPP